MLLGALCFLFLFNYNRTAIPLKSLWFVLSFFLIVGGLYINAKQLLKEAKEVGNQKFIQIEELKQQGEKIRITLENAQVKTRTYNQEIIRDRPSRIEIADALYDENRNYKSEEIRQTYIVFCRNYGSKTYKFISQATSQNAERVKLYLDKQGGIDLYIDPKNPSSYYFDFPFV